MFEDKCYLVGRVLLPVAAPTCSSNVQHEQHSSQHFDGLEILPEGKKTVFAYNDYLIVRTADQI